MSTAEIGQMAELFPEVAMPHAKGARQLLPATLVTLDAVLVYAAFSLAYWARFGLQLGPNRHDYIAFSGYQVLAPMLLALTIGTLMVKGAYRPRMSSSVASESVTMAGASTISVASVVVMTSMLHQYEYSRAVIIYIWVLLIVLLSLGRACMRGAQGMLHRRGHGVRRLLVVGASDTGKMIMQSVKNRPDLGYDIVGFVDRRGAARVSDFGRFRRMGGIDDIPSIIDEQAIDEVVIALPGSAHDDVWPIVRMCEGSQVGLKLVPDMFQMSPSRMGVDDIAGIPLLHVQDKPRRTVERAVKRGLDVLVGALALAVSLPIIAVLALLIKLDSDGPAFIKQERVGKHGRRFHCYKLRTMRKDADQILASLQAQNEAQGPLFKIRKDPRLTRLGRHIRRLSLDELPQIWNVVHGDMSMVGPRPPLPRETARYEPWQMRRLETTPGMTGLWQVSGRSNLGFDEMVMMDVMYVDNWNLALDMKILIKTITAVITARGAY